MISTTHSEELQSRWSMSMLQAYAKHMPQKLTRVRDRDKRRVRVVSKSATESRSVSCAWVRNRTREHVQHKSHDLAVHNLKASEAQLMSGSSLTVAARSRGIAPRTSVMVGTRWECGQNQIRLRLSISCSALVCGAGLQLARSRFWFYLRGARMAACRQLRVCA